MFNLDFTQKNVKEFKLIIYTLCCQNKYLCY